MELYKKLAYTGAIWGLAKYSIGLGTFAVFTAFIDITPGMNNIQETFPDLANTIHLVSLFGVIGVLLSVVVIMAIKNISFVQNKLSVILIITGIVFIGMSWLTDDFRYTVLEDNIICASTSINCALALSGINLSSIYNAVILQTITGNIPSILLIVSGILAFRIHKKQTIK